MQMVEDVHMVVGHLIYSALRDRVLAETIVAEAGE